ncbi:hypothetical protein WQ57_07720 [Mesobacillus campisalis]|uniref:Uncharacterized protein n=1 Tax=Mesobacillus campisalis TaxID=1408103 RepID=A0A0M2SZS3_9BACI|nr:hypothetical protein WQ57_07720 [Mesobacillus campisalis]
MGNYRDRDFVAGASDVYHPRRSNVAGARDRRRNDNDVAGIFDDDFRVPVRAFIESDDFCRAVRRCLRRDLVAGARDDRNDRNDRDDHRRRCSCRR